jgi:catechol 2,3-dioxygenase-like lactoylglutathione lyase family enzyme
MTLRIESIDHLQILAPSGSEPAIRAFYGDLLGLREVEKPPELRPRGGVWYRVGDGAVMLHIGTEAHPPDAGRRHFAFRVADVPGARRFLEEHGARTGEAPQVAGMPRFYGYDPFGNQIEFMNYEQGRQ